MKTNYRRGVEAEYKAMKDLEKVGYECMRTAGSHGIFDVIAIGPAGVRFIQIKRVKDKENESEIEIAKENIKKLPQLIGVSYEIWVWEDGVGWKRQERVTGKGTGL